MDQVLIADYPLLAMYLTAMLGKSLPSGLTTDRMWAHHAERELDALLSATKLPATKVVIDDLKRRKFRA
jgi:hypothetical protein